MIVHLSEAPFSDTFISEFVDLVQRVFGDEADKEWLDSLKWRLEEMPDVTVFLAEKESLLIGFKVGYAATDRRYYSWLGGIDPNFRKQGVAKKLMTQQHEWLCNSRFQIIETHVAQKNKAMIQLNLDSGLAITGMFMKKNEPNFIMQKSC